jgi:hypothetical protein
MHPAKKSQITVWRSFIADRDRDGSGGAFTEISAYEIPCRRGTVLLRVIAGSIIRH